MTTTEHCATHFGETFTEHITRCRCDTSAATWAHMRHQGHLDALAPPVADGTVEQAADEIADAVVDVHLSLLRLEWLTNMARSGGWTDLPAQARIAFTAAALDRYLIDPDFLLARAADTRAALHDLLEHIGNITPHEDQG